MGMQEASPVPVAKNKIRLQTKELVLCAVFSGLIAIGAFIRIPVPVMPFTLQFLFTNLAGLMLGSRLGALSVATYIVAGLAGVPVFTNGGGLSYVLQPTFGYILGFLVGAWAAGYVLEAARDNTTGRLPFAKYLQAGFVNLALVYALGMLHYYVVANFYIASPIGVRALVLYCFVFAVPGDAALCFVSAAVCRRVGRLTGARERRR